MTCTVYSEVMNTQQILSQLLVAYQQLLVLLQSKTAKQPATTTDPVLYTIAKACIGKHLTLDPTVPQEVGCAEAISYILWKAGLPIPAKGIAGTAALEAWVVSSDDGCGREC